MTQDEAAEFARLRDRLHKQADEIQRHDGKLIEHALEIANVKTDLASMRASMATSEQLKAAVELLTEKLANLGRQTASVQTGINWAVGLILGTVLLAILALVLKGDKSGRTRLEFFAPSGAVAAAGVYEYAGSSRARSRDRAPRVPLP